MPESYYSGDAIRRCKDTTFEGRTGVAVLFGSNGGVYLLELRGLFVLVAAVVLGDVVLGIPPGTETDVGIDGVVGG